MPVYNAAIVAGVMLPAKGRRTVRERSTWVGWGLLTLGLVGNAAGVVLSVANGSLFQKPDETLLWVVYIAFWWSAA